MKLHPCKCCEEPSIVGLDGYCPGCREWMDDICRESNERAIEMEERFYDEDRARDIGERYA
jgi:hypothetical protein